MDDYRHHTGGRNLGCILFLLLLLFPVVLPAGTVAELVAAGNRAYDEGKYDEALAAYEKAVESAPGSAVAWYNKGTALYRLGKYEAAERAFEEAAVREVPGNSRQLTGRSLFNAANSAFRRGEELRSVDPEAALAAFRSSANKYRSALEAEPDGQQAGWNLELAHRMIRTLEETLRRQQEQSGGMEQQMPEDAAGRLRKLEADQKAAAGKSRRAAKQNGTRASAGQRRQLAAEQRRLREQTDRVAGQLDTNGDRQAAAAGGFMDEAIRSQQRAEKELEQGDLERAAGEQEQAAAALGKAASRLSGREMDSSPAGTGAGPEKPAGGTDTAAGREPPATESSPAGERLESGARSETARRILREEELNRRSRQLRRSAEPAGEAPIQKNW